MPRRNLLSRCILGSAALLVLGAASAAAQLRTASDSWIRNCDRWNGDSERFCTISETTMRSPEGTLSIDGRTNGGIVVVGTSRRDVLVRAKIEASARTDARAEELARTVTIHAEGGKIYAEGPESRGHEWWSVTFEVEVPSRSDLDLRAHNGGISVAEVSGSLRMETLNGGIHLDAVGGDVIAETTNGGLSVLLDGDRWQGKGLDAVTMNGGVTVRVPDGYSAHLETGTMNGGVDIDFPVTVQGRLGRRISTDLGKGGATVRVITTNGGVNIRKRD